MSDSTVHAPIDEQLRLQDLATKTSSFNGTAIALPAGFAPGGAGMSMRAFVRVSAIDLGSGDESYTLKVQDSPDGVTFTDRSEARAITETGVSLIGCGIQNRYVRLVATIGGTTPSITYEGWLAPII